MAITLKEKQQTEEIKKTKKQSENKNENQKMNQFVNSIWFVIVIGILILVKTIVFYKNTVSLTEKLALETIFGTISFITVIVCFLCVLPNRARTIGTIAVNILISILLFGDHAYYNYSSNVLSVAQITNLQYGEEITSTLPQIVQIRQILYFLDFVILAVLFIDKNIKIEKKEKKTKKQLTMKWITGLVGLLIFCIIGVRYVERGHDKVYNKDWQIRESTIFGYHIYDIENAITYKNKTRYKNYEEMEEDYQKLKGEYQEKYGEEKYSLKGILEGKNMIIVQLESLQEFVLHKKINGQEITPNLNRFLAQNVEFSNMHMQSYSTTADSEHSIITSTYPMENGMAFSQYYMNTYDDIFNLYKRANYETAYVHGNDGYFWNRGNVYGKIGVENIVLKDQLEETEYINGFLSDETVYCQAVQKMKSYQQPFLSFVVAASSHTPFELEGLQDRSKVKVDVGKYKGTYFGNYLEAANYADYAFGILLDNLKKEGIYEDTAILVFGDHNGLNMYNEEMIDFLKATNPNLNDVDIKLNYTRVACGFKIPGLKHIKIEKPVSKLDIKPTLTYLSGIEDGFSLGTNLFASKEFVALNNERIITNQYYYDENWYEIKTAQEIEKETINQEVKQLLEQYERQMKTELDISESVIIHNLLEK